MKRTFKLFAGMIAAVIIILCIPVSRTDAATPKVINIILGEASTTVKTGQSQYRVYSAPYGLDIGYVDAGENIKVYFKEYSAGTMYYYIEFQGSYGRKRGYIPASSINEVNIITRSFPTTANCYAKTTIPIKNGNTQWFDSNYDHTLNKGDLVTVLAQVGNWFMVEHYHNGRNIRGFVDFARIDYYKINEHYTRNHSVLSLGAFQLKYVRADGFLTSAAQSVASQVAALWSNCDGNEDHVHQNWSVSEVSQSQADPRNTVVIQSINNIVGVGEAGITTTTQYAGQTYVGIYIHPSVMKGTVNKTPKSVLCHELGHVLGLNECNGTGMIMDQNRPSSIQTPQLGDYTGVWDYYNGYYNGYSRP